MSQTGNKKTGKNTSSSRLRRTQRSKLLIRSDHYIFRKLLWLILAGSCFVALFITAMNKPELVKPIYEPVLSFFSGEADLAALKQENQENFRQAIANEDCEALTRVGVNSLQAGETFPLKQAIPMAECFLLDGNSSQAMSVFSTYLDQIKDFSTAQLNDWSKADLNGEAFLLMVLSMIYQLKFGMARKLVAERCENWQFSATCIGRLIVMSFSKDQSSLASNIYKSLTKTPELPTLSHSEKILRLYAHFAGAIAASQQFDKISVNRIFNHAINNLPEEKHSLEKLFYYEWVLALFKIQQFKQLPGLVDKALANSTASDHNWTYKLSALKLLSSKKQRKNALKSLFSSRDTLFTFSNDIRLLNLLTPIAINFAFARQMVSIVDATYRKYRDYPADQRFLYEIQLLKPRVLIAAEKHLEASEFFQKSWDSNIRGYEFNHLNGLALLLGAQKKAQILQAKSYFEQSIKEQLNWQSLYGKAKASIQLKQYREAEQTLKVLTQLQVGQKSEKNFWTDLLRAELLLIAKKPRQLLKMITRRFKKQREQPDVLALKASAYYMLGNAQKARRIEERADSKKVNKTRFYFWNKDAPMHPMVFHDKSL